MHRALARSALAALVLSLPIGSARAAEGENAFSVSFGYGTYSIPDENPHGAVLAFDYERGFSDAVWLRVTGGGGSFLGSTGEGDDLRLSYSGHGTLGLTYIIDDTLKYVPYANLGVGGIVIGGGGVDPDLHALVELGFGVDILQSRTFSYGVQLRVESFVEETAFFTAGARATWRWGFF